MFIRPFIIILFAFFSLTLLGRPLWSGFPNGIYLKNSTRSFNHQWYVILEEGKIWFKNIAEGGDWIPLGKEGWPDILPKRETIKEISADGDNLIAVSTENIVYYAKFSSLVWSPNRKFMTMSWTHEFGKPLDLRLLLHFIPFLGSKQILHVPQEYLSLAISHRGEITGGCEDIDNNFHPISFGVTTLYLLSKDGHSIHYADPWIPAHFDRMIDGPTETKEGRFKAVALSASASTMMLINEVGTIYTRLADFDTIGENPLMRYSFLREFRSGSKVRSLPGEDWKEQPRVPGKITDLITILQNGRGNAGRELRIEGIIESQGITKTGYFSKPISLLDFSSQKPLEWKFIETNEPILGRFLNSQEPEKVLAEKLWGPKLGKDYTMSKPIKAQLLGFHPKIRKARILFQTNNGNIELTLHTYRLDDFAPKNKILGAVEIPRDVTLDKYPHLQDTLKKIFKDKNTIHTEVYYYPLKERVDISALKMSFFR